VTVANPTPTTVETSYTSGYMGMVAVGTAVGVTIAYGTGYYYPPYYYWGPMYPYPIYYPWPVTYGVGAVYNPYTGGFYVGRAAYGPYGAVGGSAWYNPATGRYGRAATAQTWYGGRTAAAAYNPWTGGYGATRQGHSPYAQWGQSAVVRGDDPVKPGEAVVVVGFPLQGLLSWQASVTAGIVSRLTGPRDDPHQLQITAAVQPGNSGSPVLDESGAWLASSLPSSMGCASSNERGRYPRTSISRSMPNTLGLCSITAACPTKPPAPTRRCRRRRSPNGRSSLPF